jgi:predicted amidophosphoribosyltransferase
MTDIDQLPIPDWGLRCPHCDAPLAGMTEHVCSQCGQAFNVRVSLGQHRPIPDIGLTCPACGYLLTGLMANRCPECFAEFSVSDLSEEGKPGEATYLTVLADPHDHHVIKRRPTFTGGERPLPDFGLVCWRCNHALAGATGDLCPGCGAPFNLLEILPGGQLVDITRFVPAHAELLAKTILYTAQVPYLIEDAGINQVYGMIIPLATGRIRVPREFFFDALYALATSARPAADYAQQEWTCPNCRQSVPAGFEICWNCNAGHPGKDPRTGQVR